MLDAILIPGGGVTQNGELYPWVAARFDLALTHDKDTVLYIPLSRGTVYKPSSYIESEVGKQYLIAHGVDPDRILTETMSMDTIGNAYFSRIQLTDPRQLYRLHIITSEFHLPRTQVIFDWVFGLSPHLPYHLTYEANADTTMPTDILAARIEKEAQSLHNLTPTIPSIISLEDLKTWLYSAHTAYNGKGIDDIDPLLEQSY